MKLELQLFNNDTWVSILTKWSYIQIEGEFVLKSIENDLMSKKKGIAHCVCRIEETKVEINSLGRAFAIVCMGA